MVFQDRHQAGLKLAEKLTAYRGQDAVVLGLPRGGLGVARPVADRLGLPLDIIVARKIGAPGNEELAIGAVTTHGTRVLNVRLIRLVLLPPNYLEAETARQRAIASRREEVLRDGYPRVSPSEEKHCPGLVQMYPFALFYQVTYHLLLLIF
jgi:putative phosphoribosyl transferase